MTRISDFYRHMILKLKYNGKNIKKIKETLLSNGLIVSRQSISQFIKRYERTGSLKDRRKVRKSIFTPEMKESINKWIDCEREITLVQLRSRILRDFSTNVSDRNLRRIVKLLGWQKCNKKYCQLSNKENKSAAIDSLQQINDNNNNNNVSNNNISNTSNNGIQSTVNSLVNTLTLTNLNNPNDVINSILHENGDQIRIDCEELNELVECSNGIINRNFSFGTSNGDDSDNDDNDEDDGEIECIRETIQPLANKFSATNGYGLNEEKLNDLLKNSNSGPNFAVQLCRHLFRKDEIKNRNVYGKNFNKGQKKQALDQKRVNYIKETCLRLCKYENADKFWTQCVHAINKYILRIKDTPSMTSFIDESNNISVLSASNNKDSTNNSKTKASVNSNHSISKKNQHVLEDLNDLRMQNMKRQWIKEMAQPVSNEAANYGLDDTKLRHLLNNSISGPNFAVQLCRHLFKKDELHGKNVNGKVFNKKQKKQPLDTRRVEFIKETCLRMCKYDVADKFWTQCVHAMNKYILRVNQRKLSSESNSSNKTQNNSLNDTISSNNNNCSSSRSSSRSDASIVNNETLDYIQDDDLIQEHIQHNPLSL